MHRRAQVRLIVSYAVAYSAWILSSLLVIVVALLFRAAINTFYVLLGLPANAHHFVDYTMLFVIGGVLIVVLIGGESYFRDGVQRGDLRRRIVRVFGWSAVACIVLYLAPLLATWLAGSG
jgi:uncharacterized integral membrane protein